MTSIIDKSIISGLSCLKNPTSTISTLLIESCCTSGRTYQSYKRGGSLEAKERFREEVTCAAFWLWGIKGLNKLGDLIGKYVFKINDMTDTGKDALRNPAYHMSNKAKIFKFSKIISSIIITTGLIGFVVPRINHAITDKMMKKNKQKKLPDMGNYIDNTKNNNNSKYETNFKGNSAIFNGIMTATYNLENKNSWRLISTDAGMLAGRVYNARHPAERFEYLFRDLCSMFFYNFSTSLVVLGLNKLFKKTDIHPKAVSEVCEFLKDKNLTGKQILASMDAPIDNMFYKIKFNADGSISLQDLLAQFKALGIFDEHLKQKSTEMSKLQPLLKGEISILSKEQVKDVFSKSITADPEFLSNAINEASGKRALAIDKFISAKECQKIRESIDGYIREIANKAGDKIIDGKYLKNNKVLRKTLGRIALFHILGMAVSAFGLAILIPRLQIFLSQKLFGKQSFEDIVNGNKKDGK